jgi:hypothetical protein
MSLEIGRSYYFLLFSLSFFGWLSKKGRLRLLPRNFHSVQLLIAWLYGTQRAAKKIVFFNHHPVIIYKKENAQVGMINI